MVKKNVKVFNPNKHDININLRSFNQRLYEVKGGGFTMLTEEELAYVSNASSVFKDGNLIVQNDEVLEYVETQDIVSKNSLSQGDIEDLLKMTQKEITAKLSEVDNLNVVKRVLKVATELDKSVRVVAIIENRIEELMS